MSFPCASVLVLCIMTLISGIRSQINDNNQDLEGKFCPELKGCYTLWKTNNRYRCARDEICTTGYKCCKIDCYTHKVCVLPVDRKGKEIPPPLFSSSTASSTSVEVITTTANVRPTEVHEVTRTVLTTKVRQTTVAHLPTIPLIAGSGNGGGDGVETQKPTSTVLPSTQLSRTRTTKSDVPSTKLLDTTKTFHTTSNTFESTNSADMNTAEPFTVFTTRIKETTLGYLPTKHPVDGNRNDDDDDDEDGDDEDYGGSGDDEDYGGSGNGVETQQPTSTVLPHITTKIVKIKTTTTEEPSTKLQETTTAFHTPIQTDESSTSDSIAVTSGPSTLFTARIKETTHHYLASSSLVDGSGNSDDDEDDDDEDYGNSGDGIEIQKPTSTVLPFTITELSRTATTRNNTPSIKPQDTTTIFYSTSKVDESSTPSTVTTVPELSTILTLKIRETTKNDLLRTPPLNEPGNREGDEDGDDQDYSGSGDDQDYRGTRDGIEIEKPTSKVLPSTTIIFSTAITNRREELSTFSTTSTVFENIANSDEGDDNSDINANGGSSTLYKLITMSLSENTTSFDIFTSTPLTVMTTESAMESTTYRSGNEVETDKPVTTLLSNSTTVTLKTNQSVESQEPNQAIPGTYSPIESNGPGTEYTDTDYDSGVDGVTTSYSVVIRTSSQATTESGRFENRYTYVDSNTGEESGAQPVTTAVVSSITINNGRGLPVLTSKIIPLTTPSGIQKEGLSTIKNDAAPPKPTPPAALASLKDTDDSPEESSGNGDDKYSDDDDEDDGSGLPRVE